MISGKEISGISCVRTILRHDSNVAVFLRQRDRDTDSKARWRKWWLLMVEVEAVEGISAGCLRQTTTMSLSRPRPRCPRCIKRFATQADVLRHMNHPATSCSSWSGSIGNTIPPVVPPAPPTTPFAPNSPLLDPEIPEHTGDDGELEGLDLGAGIGGDGPFVERYEGAAKTFGDGPSFLNQFDLDRYAKERETNIYYPFASNNDWKLASWVLRSGLSMRAIDEFLSLQIVRSI